MRSIFFHIFTFLFLVCFAISASLTHTQLTVIKEIPLKEIRADKGYAYSVSLKPSRLLFNLPNENFLLRSLLVMMENGQPLEPAHLKPEIIRQVGGGRFSHQDGDVFFSTRDNSDPRVNARVYSLGIELTGRVWKLFLLAAMVSLVFADPTPLQLLTSAVTTNWRAIRVIISFGWRPGMVCLALAASTFLYQSMMPVAEWNEMMETNLEKKLIRQQYNRAARSGWDADIIFNGDSSCLTGIDFIKLGSITEKSVKSLCTMAYVGPNGWGKMLEKQVASSGKPHGMIVFVMHPVGFKRGEDWGEENWIDFMKRMDQETPLHNPTNTNRVFMTIRNKLLNNLIFQPMPGKLGVYYGNLSVYAEHIRDSGGSIDPKRGLDQKVITEHDAQDDPLTTSNNLISRRENIPVLTPNHLFEVSLSGLNKRIEALDLDRNRIFIAITPVPDLLVNEQFHHDRNEAILIISRELSLDRKQFLDLPIAMSNIKFSSNNHLNRHGRNEYTHIIAKTIGSASKPDLGK